MKVAVITPLGMGHEQFVLPCRRSVGVASDYCPGIEVEHIILTDDGRGRSATRNAAMEQAEGADWYFFLDADDEMTETALVDFLALLETDRETDAFYGLLGGTSASGTGEFPRQEQPMPTEWKHLVSWPIDRMLSVSGFFRAAPARDIGFHEGADLEETWEFSLAHAAKYSWRKVNAQFTHIHLDRPSATGPRGYSVAKPDWHKACAPVRDYWRRRGPIPMSQQERTTRYWNQQ